MGKTKPATRKQVGRWCFTLNNPSIAEERMLQRRLGDGDHVKFAVAGREKAETTGTPHVQGFVVLRRSSRLAGLKRLLGTDRLHAKPDKGTDSENLKYCTKEGDVLVKYGTPESRGETKAQKVIRLALRLRGRDPTSKELQEDAELAEVFVDPRTRDALTEIGALRRREDVSSNLRTAFERCKLRPWQSRLLHELKTTRIDESAILWYVDRDGNTGKTWFARYCEVLEGASVVQATGKIRDMACSYREPRGPLWASFEPRVVHLPHVGVDVPVLGRLHVPDGHERPADVAERLEVCPAAVHQFLDVLLVDVPALGVRVVGRVQDPHALVLLRQGVRLLEVVQLQVPQDLELVEDVQVAVHLRAGRRVVEEVHVEVEAPRQRVRGDLMLGVGAELDEGGPLYDA